MEGEIVTEERMISLLMEKVARSIQSSIWNLQNALDDLQRLGVVISTLNNKQKGIIEELRSKKKGKEK